MTDSCLHPHDEMTHRNGGDARAREGRGVDTNCTAFPNRCGGRNYWLVLLYHTTDTYMQRRETSTNSPMDSSGSASNGLRARPTARREGSASAMASQGCNSNCGSLRSGSTRGKNPVNRKIRQKKCRAPYTKREVYIIESGAILVRCAAGTA